MPRIEQQDKQAQVLAQLATVSDPELDEAVTELGFIQEVRIREEERVSIQFRLPTYWCAPNFAFLMASDMRQSVARLPWVKEVTVELRDHCCAEEINQGIAAGQTFSQSFPGEASEDLEELRDCFRQKAFQGRQERLLRALLGAGHPAQSLARLTIRDLEAMRAGEPEERRRLIDRYLSIRQTLPHSPGTPQDWAFLTVAGAPLTTEGMPAYLRELRRVRVSIELNRTFCRGLLQTRYGLSPAEMPLDADE
jgi:metal-sulfur cluster biosynthetic enzyme